MKRHSTKWKYRNTALLFLSLVVLFFVADTQIAHALIKEIGSYGYLGAFVVGIFFVSTFTIAPAMIVLFHLAQDFNPWLIALCAGSGGVIGDLIIFKFLKDGVFDELRPIFRKLGGARLRALMKTPLFAWSAPVLGAIIITSPFPDELGIALMGLSHIKLWQFIMVVFVLDVLGILFIVLLARNI